LTPRPRISVLLSHGILAPHAAGAPPAVTVPQGRKSRPLWKQLVAAFLLGCVLLGLKILVFGK